MPDLESLVWRCSQGDEAAFVELFRSQQAHVYRLAMAILRDPHDAEDAVQETFVRVFDQLARFRGESSFQTWLTAIAVNVCRDRLRARKVRRALSLDRLRRQAGRIDVADAVAGRQHRQALWSLVDRLEDGLRLPLILFYVERLSCEEIAGILGLRVNTVYSRLFTARERLRAMLEAQPVRGIDLESWEASFAENES